MEQCCTRSFLSLPDAHVRLESDFERYKVLLPFEDEPASARERLKQGRPGMRGSTPMLQDLVVDEEGEVGPPRSRPPMNHSTTDLEIPPVGSRRTIERRSAFDSDPFLCKGLLTEARP